MGKHKRPELPASLRKELGLLQTVKTSHERPAKRRRIAEKSPEKSARKPAKTALEKLADKQKPVKKDSVSRKAGQSQIEQDEDEKIAWLEAQLGGKQSSKFSKELEEDGLDDLFADLDRIEADEPLASDEEGPSEEEVHLIDLRLARAHSMKLTDNSEEAEVSLDDSDSAEDDGEEWHGFSDAEAGEQQVHFADEQTNGTNGRYVPPHMREKAATAASAVGKPTIEGSLSDPRLRRLLLGHLNKLSSSNMPTILAEFEAIYRSHPRGVVSAQLAALLLDLVASRDAIGEPFLLVYATLVAALSRLIGKELGAMVVARGIEIYDGAEVGDLMGSSSARPGPKERTNIVAFFAELYNCQVVACTLIYDLVRTFIDAGLEEAEVEMLLKVLRVCGPQLRQDDPAALKQIIQLVQDKQKAKEPASISSRQRFMVEALTNLKNNKVKADNVSAADASVSLKKFLASLAKQRSLSIPEPLRLTLADLRSSSSKGKWWLVGAAWGGDPLVDAQPDGATMTLSKKSAGDDEVWLKLARQQGMNTDVRKSIFVALMGSEDYVDACERLSELGLKEVQQREIIRVVLHCAGKEKAYNPFYTLVMQHFIARSPKTAHSVQITLQYALWDLLRDMGESAVGGAERLASLDDTDADSTVSPRRARNIARAYGWWLAKGSLSLTIFKPLFSALLLSTQSESPLLAKSIRRDQKAVKAVFAKLPETSSSLARGIRHFLETHIATSHDELLVWAAEIADEALRV